jgi:DNA helicase-2/ATP-dependent DNA helicase PcrA
VLADIFSMAVNQRLTTPANMEKHYSHFEELTAKIDEVGRRYVERKRAANAMDFDDLLALWLRLLEEHADVRDQYQRRFQFILVDEYQDTNKLQSDLIDLLGARHKNVMVVGDDSQSIYSWRGANFRNIFEFPTRYPGASTYKIETNYRSTPEILSVANAVIAANTEQFAKELVPARPSGVKPVLIACGDGYEQAAFVAQRILELREEGADMNQMMVLYRSHFHALELQLELTRRNIPFSITSGIRFFEQAHVKDVTSHLRLVCNPNDELAFKRVVQLLPGIGGKGADKLWALFLTAISAGAGGSASSPVATAIQQCAGSVPKKAAAAWAQFAATLAQLEASPVRQNAAQMIRLVVEAGYEDYIHATFTNADNRLEDLEQLANFALQFPSPEEFLAQMALLTNIEAEEQPAGAKDDEQVRLSTIHQAKGLEFDIVFIIMLCDGLFPSARSMESTEGEEEERRLFYVAVTRAKNELYLSYPLIRVTQGYSGDMMQQPSRFLAEIPKDRLDEWNLRPFNPYG